MAINTTLDKNDITLYVKGKAGETITYTDNGGNDVYSFKSLAGDVVIDDKDVSDIILLAGTNITAAQFSTAGVELTIDGHKAQFFGDPSKFKFIFAGDPTNSSAGVTKTLAETAVAFGITAPLTATPQPATTVGVIATDGSIGGGVTPATYTLTADKASVEEGSSVELTLAVGTAPTVDTTYKFSIIGDSIKDSQGNASASPISTVGGEVDVTPVSGTVTIAAGSTTGKFTLSAVSDVRNEGLEGMKISIFDANNNVVATKILTVDDVTSPDTIVTLTENSDIKSGNIFNADLVYTPGGDDRINSLQDEDQLTGTGANPTLNAILGNANDNGGVIITPKLTDIETINVAFTGSGGAGGPVTALDLQDASGQKEINITRVSQAANQAEVGNIMSANVANMSVSNTNANQAGVVEFSFAAGVLKGSNTGDIEVSNVVLGALNIGENTSLIGARGVGTNGYENLTMNSTGSANTIGTLNMPMDTGTTGSLVITGDKALTLSTTANIVTNGTTNVEAVGHAGGVAQPNGRLEKIDASGLDAAFTLNIPLGLLSTGKADTSGVNQDVTITGTKHDDTFYLNDLVQAGDKIDGGDGNNDTLIAYQGGVLGTVSKVEYVDIQMLGTTGVAGSGSVTMDMSKFADTTAINMRNISALDLWNATLNLAVGAPIPGTALFAAADDIMDTAGDPGSDQVTTLNNLNATQAANLSVQHSTTLNNAITDTRIVAGMANSTGTNDLVAVTIKEGVNIDPRFNFLLDAGGAVGIVSGTAVESVTITDSDTESNTVGLQKAALHTGTITLKGGLANTFINLDTTTLGGNGGIYQYDVTGAADLNSSNAGATVGRIADNSLTANQVKLIAATVDASAEASNVIVRVSSSPNTVSVVGAQTISMGSGNDTVIFDNINDTRAGLTISDKVSGGAGTDTLVIDGDLTGLAGGVIQLGASEWTNVSGFENIRTVGAGVAGSYNLTVTNNLLAANKDANGYLNFINDNDLLNNNSVTAGRAAALIPVVNTNGTTVLVINDDPAAAAESAVVLDARTLSAGSKFSYKGEEGLSRTADRIILSDANIDGNAIIDGGAIDNINNNSGIASLDTLTLGVNGTVVGNAAVVNGGNADVIEVRNQAVVSQGDLANIKNIGTLSFTSDVAVTQVSTLQLNDNIVDSLVDSYQASASRAAAATQTAGGANVERLTINAIDNMNVAGATVGLTIEAGTLTDKSDLNITLGRGANTVVTGAGQDNITLLGNYVAGTYAAGLVVNGVNINNQSTAAGLGVRVVTDNINFGTGTDTLTTYGAINIAGATLAGLENIVANSALVINASQLAAVNSLTFNSTAAHQLVIVDDTAGAIDLSKIIVAGGTLQYNIVGGDGLTSNAVVVSPTNVGGTAIVNAALTTANIGGGTVTPVGSIAINPGVANVGTNGTNDTFYGPVASLNNTTITGGTGTDVDRLLLTDAINTTTLGVALGAGAATAGGLLTNIDQLVLSNGTNVLTFAAGTGINSIIGGSGDDSVTLTNLAAGGAVNLGAGTDTLTAATEAIIEGAGSTFVGGDGTTDSLVFTAAMTTATLELTNVSGFETINLGAVAGGGLTVNSAAPVANTSYFASGVRTLIGDTTAGNITVNMSAAQLDALTTITSAAAGNTFTIATVDTGAVTVNLADTVFTTLANVDSITFALGTSATVTIDENIAVTGTASADILNVTADLGAVTLASTNFETINVSSSQTGLTIANTATTVNASAGGTFTLGTGGDTFTGSGTTVVYTVTGNAGADTISFTNTAGNTVAGAAGLDTITLNATNAAIDVIRFNDGAGTNGITALADRDTISGFNVSNDIIRLDSDQTTVAYAAIQSLAAAGAVTTGTGVASVLSYSFDMGGVVNVLAGVTDGSGILANNGGAITVTASDKGYIVAYDGGNAYLYAYNDTGNTALAASEINLIGVFNGVAIGGLGSANFTEAA